MSWTGKTVFVTGADGFIGSHLAQRLVELGARVRALVYYNSFGRWGWLDALPEAVRGALDVVAGDVRDPFCMEQAAAGCETVFHLAALIAIPYSYAAPQSYVDTNVRGTLNVLEACRRAGVKKLVHTSTSEVYGTARRVPIAEDHPLQPQSPYSATKTGADSLALSYFSSFGLPVALIRPFNVYGPRQSARAVIPTIIGQVLAGGGSVRLGSLTPTRDYTFVADTVEGFLSVAQSPASAGEVVNVGSGAEISIGDLARRIARLCGRPEVRIEEDPARLRPEKSEVMRLLCDRSKAKKLLSWEPRVGLDEGLARTIEWFRPNLGQYKTGLYNV